ncbi:MAG: putative baseplate assembly protein [Actinomycetota bacterium]|nr:putative baseplate assembly protein [Actinomycetota bacterium]
MPLEDHIPRLDDHSYDSIVAEMRSRISRYTPEWTPVWSDLNDSDPGITMLQVFAWLGEMLAYRMNQVPALNYLKFLQLLGVELRAAEPAQVQIGFQMKAAHPKPTAIVPLGTQVIAETEGGGPPLVFEATTALTVLRPRLTAAIAYDGNLAYESVTQANDTASPFLPLGPTAVPGGALLLGFEDSVFPATELTLYAWAAEAGSRAPVTCGLEATPSYPSATMRWSAWTGFDWSPITLLKDDTLAFTRSGEIVLRTPDNLATTVVAPDPTAKFWLRAELVTSQYERPPKLLAIRTNTMTLTQMETVRDEVLGGSTGRPDQTFRLTNVPVLAKSLDLEVDQGSGPEVWTEVTDFLASSSRDTHYVLNRSTGEVRFGDGRRGAVPIANVNNPGANVVARRYAYGGGTKGNVAGGALTALRNAVPGVDDNGVGNLMASYGGRDEETLDQAKQRAPAAIRARCRAVTADDFEFFATQAADIARAKALPLRHPGFPGVAVPGVVTVLVVPDSDVPNPLPSEGTLRTVCAYLDQRRLLTTEVYVVPPAYQEVCVRVDLVARESADLAQVQRDVETSLLSYFHPLHGGEDGLGWPFGGTISFSRTFQRVFSVDGVSSVDRVLITVDGEEAAECRDVRLEPDALAYSVFHDVSVSYASAALGST